MSRVCDTGYAEITFPPMNKPFQTRLKTFYLPEEEMDYLRVAALR
jgi:hypothetical protein